MDEAPSIEVHIVPSVEQPGGIGEPGTAAVLPALGNAVFAATGKRLNKLPAAETGLTSTMAMLHGYLGAQVDDAVRDIHGSSSKKR